MCIRDRTIPALPMALLELLLCDDEAKAYDIVREYPQLLGSVAQALMGEMLADVRLSMDEPRIRILEERQRLLEHVRAVGIDRVATMARAQSTEEGDQSTRPSDPS